MVSVRGRLVTAIGLVAAMTVVAGLVSWLFYSRIEKLLLSVIHDETPMVSLSLKLAEASSRFAGGSLAYSAARNQLQRQSVAVALDQQAHQLEAIMASLRNSAIDHTRLDKIQGLVAALESNLEQQNLQVERQITIDTHIRRARTGFQRQIDAFSQALHEAAARDGNNPAMVWLWEVEAVGNRMIATIAEADHLERISDIEACRAQFETLRNQLIALFPSGFGHDPVAKAAETLIASQQGAGSRFDELAAAIGVRDTLRVLNEASHDIVSQLSIAVVRLDDEVETRAAEMGRLAGEQISVGRVSMLAIAIATFLGPMVFVWLLIGRTVVVPLTSLAYATRRIASGDLTVPIPTSGTSEVAELAAALEVFRDNAVALQQAKNAAEGALKDLRQAQEQLIQSEKLAALGGLVAGVAHEINTPVGVVLTGASLLAEETEAIQNRTGSGNLRRSDLLAYLDVARESTTIILNNTRRAADLIQSFKHVAADQTNDTIRRFNLSAYLAEVVTSLSPSWRKLGHSVVVNCPEDIEIVGHPGMFFQILTNFITNSLTHGFDPEEKGIITITVYRQTQDQIELVYTDTGRGISAADQSRVFDPFYTTRRSAGCIGLGLSIVYNLVTLRLGGQIRLESREGEGVRFILKLPCVAADSQPLS